MKRRNRAAEISARKVRCAYCDWEDKQKYYKQHCERVHRGKCAKLRGQPTLAESLMMRSKKKKKVADSHKPALDNSSPATDTSSQSQGTLSRLSSIVFSLLSFLNPLQSIVESLRQSADKIEESLKGDRKELATKRAEMTTIHEFHRSNQSAGLFVSNSGKFAFGFCKKCMKYEDNIKSAPYFDEDWTVSGKRLRDDRKRQWDRHTNSKMHKLAMEIEKSRSIKSMISAGAHRAKQVTYNFFRLAYACVLMYVPYRRFVLLNAALSLCGFETGNRHHNADAAASVVDTFYDFFRTRLGQHVASLNSVTGRPRQFFSSADKGTELNQRQVINMTLFDVDGKSINVHLSAHLINEIDLGEGEAEESTARALLEHHYKQFAMIGLQRDDAQIVWVGKVTDKEACYVLMGKLAKDDCKGFQSINDVAHGVESLFDDVEKEIQWVDSTLSIIDVAHGRYAHSPKRKRKLRRTAAAFTQVYTTLKRIVETRYIKYSVVAGDALIKMFRILVAVCEDDWASTKDDAAQGLLRNFKKKNTIPNLMTLLDVLDHAVELSCCSQSEEFSIFFYLDKRRHFVKKIKTMSQESFDVSLKIDGSSKYYSARLQKYESDIRRLEINGVKLGVQGRGRSRSMRSNHQSDGNRVFEECLQMQQKVCRSILNHLHRLPEDSLFLSIEITTHPREIVKQLLYSGAFYKPHLIKICKSFQCENILAAVIVGHERFTEIIKDKDLQTKFAGKWMIKNRWNPLGVIETFMDPSSGLSDGIQDFLWVLEKVGVIRLSSNDTERVVKTIRKTETRFAGYNETKEQEGKRDRANQEIFLRENRVGLYDLPLQEINELWLKSHLPSLKHKSTRDVSVAKWLEKDFSKHKFWSA